MLRRTVPWLVVLLTVPTIALLALGLAAADDAAPAAPVNCLYLPMVGAANPGVNQPGAAARPLSAPAGNCPPLPDALATVTGNVQLRPEHRIEDGAAMPIQYVVVLDQSGSMSANFDGQCDHDSSSNPNPPARNFYNEPAAFWQCANGPLYDSDGDGVGDTLVTDRVTGVGWKYYWANRDERRITVAKRAIETLVKQTNMPGNAGYNATIPDDQMALVWFTERVQRDGNAEIFVNGGAFTNSRDELIARMWARTTGLDMYRTQGGTNATAGLYRASLLLNDAPTEVVHNGQAYRYRRVVLLITDGVTNQFFHPSESDLQVRPSDESTYPNGHLCRTFDFLLIEDADCQTTAVGGIYTTTLAGVQVGLDRPMTQLARVSQDYLQRNGDAVFVVALSNLKPSVIADAVPLFPSYFYAAPVLVTNADGTTNVDQIIEDIATRVSSGEETCRPLAAPGYVGTMGEANRPVSPTLTFPDVGMVTLRSTTSATSYTAPIRASEADGSLSYNVVNVPPGVYTLTARVLYRGDDGVTRVYGWLDVADVFESRLTVTVDAAGPVQIPLFLRLSGDVCAT